MLAENRSYNLEQSEVVALPVQHAPASSIIVVGSGPVGMRFAEKFLQIQPSSRMTVFGNEPFAPYNRVQLSGLLAGEVRPDQIDIPLPSSLTHPNFDYQVRTITAIDRVNKQVLDNLGDNHHYDTLVLATGARAHVPNIPGTDLAGVFRFRSMMDAEALFARVVRSRHIVIVGGGLLGLEAAKALLRDDTKVTVIQQASHLMNRQLDQNAAGLLQAEVERIGIEVITRSGVREVLGRDTRVDGVRLYSGSVVACDTVLLCAGIQPNKELALRAGLSVGQGIVVDDQLRTSDPDIFAVGECCEHAGKTYGLVSPGYEQAAVAANVISGGDALYKGSISVSRLKVVGQQVCSMGEVVELVRRAAQTEILWRQNKAGQYRKIVLLKGRLIGALAYGDWPEVSRVQMSFQNKVYIWPWQRALFALTGRLWPDQTSDDIQAWPAKAVVCQCNAVTKQALSDEINKGCADLCSLQKATGAGTVCGSCKPLLCELVDSGQPAPKEFGWRSLLLFGLLALLAVGAIVAIPEAEHAASVQQKGWFEAIWSDKLWKQVSGFTVLGLTLIGLLLSLRKRLGWSWLGGVAQWRMAHSVIGVACALVVMLHTGFHLGENLNRWLMLNFLLILSMGALTGLVVSLSHHFPPLKARTLRKSWAWFHILVSWPLLALLSVHIFTVYYF